MCIFIERCCGINELGKIYILVRKSMEVMVRAKVRLLIQQYSDRKYLYSFHYSIYKKLYVSS